MAKAVLQELSNELAQVVEASGLSVVRVEARRSPASGVVWSPDGLVLTAHHAVQWDEGIEIGLPDGATVGAELVGRDPTTDLAVLRIRGVNLAPPRWADAAAIKVGHLAVALARPGRSVRASMGIVSVRGDSWRTPAGGRVDHYLQTDLERHPGFSGGLLVGATGEALGVNTTGLLRGASLALPGPTLRRVAESLLAHGHVRRGYLGVGTYAVRLPRALAAVVGRDAALLVVSVDDGSPAAQAGLHMGDVLLAFDKHPLAHPMDLVPLLEETPIGATVSLRVARAGDERDITITIRQREPRS